MNTQTHTDIEVHVLQGTPLLGMTGKTIMKFLPNSWTYEIWGQVDPDDNQPGETYMTLVKQRYIKAASVDGFNTRAAAIEAMKTEAIKLIDTLRDRFDL